EDLGDLAKRPGVGAAGVRVHEAELLDELAVLGEFQNMAIVAAVAANPDVALLVDRDPVVRLRPLEVLSRRRSAPRFHEIAGLIEGEHRRRALAAFGG